jgi:nitrogen fixation protein NifU and related proteins
MKGDFDKIDEFTLGNPQAQYSPAYIEHALKPRNVGNHENANGYGCLTAHDGSAMEIWLKVDSDLVISSSFWTEGCGATIACGSVLTEMVRDKDLGQAFEITPEDVDAALGGLPGEGCTCAKLAVDTLRAALRDYLTYKNEPWRRKYSRR